MRLAGLRGPFGRIALAGATKESRMTKHVYFTALCVAVALSAQGVAVAQTQPRQNPADSAASITKLNSEDRGFLTRAAESGYLEIEGSKLALKKSSNAQVKQFAQKMIDDHTQVAQQLQALAKRKGYETPSAPSLVQSAKLKALELRGDGFDEAYTDEVGVAAHKDAIELFEKAAKEATDADLKRFAADTLPALKRHLEEARALQKSVKSHAK